MSSRESMAWLFSSNILFFVVQFITSIIVARLLSPAEMGIYAICMAATWLLQALQNIGLSSFVVVEADLSRRKLGTVLTITAIQGVFLATLFWVLAPLLADAVSEPRVEPALRILCLFAFVLPLRGTLDGLLQRRLEFQRLAGVLALDVAVAAVVTIWGAYAGLSYASMSWGAVAGIYASTALQILLLHRHIRVPPSLAYWREVWSFGVHLLAIAIIKNICTRAPEIVLGRFSGVSAVGLFNRGAGLINVFNGAILTSVQRLAQPLFVQSQSTDGGLRLAFIRSLQLVTGLTWPMLAGLAVLAYPVVELLYGPKWESAAPVVSLLGVAMIIDLALACRSEALVAAGRVQLLSRREVIASVLGLLLFILGAQYGLYVAAATRIIASIISIIMFINPITSTINSDFRQIFRVWIESLIITTCTILPAIVLMTALDWPAHLPVAYLLLPIALGALIWLGAIFVLKHPLSVEIAMIWRRFQPGRTSADL